MISREEFEAACAALWEPEHEFDFYHRGRKWDTAQDLTMLYYQNAIEVTRWRVGIVLYTLGIEYDYDG